MKFQSTTSYILITFFVFAIIISFAFTGADTGGSFVGGGGSSVATVGSYKISATEYNRAFTQETQRYAQIFGGKPLTAEQIRNFRIKEGALNRLVQQKLILNMADDMKLGASIEEIKADIKSADYFQTNKKFDVNKYKGLLQANSLTPARFEKMTQETVRLQSMAKLFESLTPSKKALETKLTLEAMDTKLDVFTYEKEKLVSKILISDKELNDFLSKKESNKILESLYNGQKEKYQKQAEVKARHILVKDAKKANELKAKVTTKNFSKIAGEQTEDPSGKGAKGGSLGWFSKGKMVPEFEKMAFSMKPGTISAPVKTSFGYHIIYVEDVKKEKITPLEKVKKELAQNHLRKTKREELTKISKELESKVKQALEKNDSSRLKKLASEYQATFSPDVKLSATQTAVGGVSLSNKLVSELFDSKQTNKVFEDKSGVKTALLAARAFTSKEEAKKIVAAKLDKEFKTNMDQLNNQVQTDVLEYLKDEIEVNQTATL